jgi:hypothetical protein
VSSPTGGDRSDPVGDQGDDHGADARRRRLASVFGEVLPDQTSDDRGDAWGDRDADGDEWLRRQVPPHHG